MAHADPDELDDLAHTALTLAEATGDEVRCGQLQLVVIGNGTFSTHPVQNGAAVTVGRSNRCEISVDDESISRRHAVVRFGESVTIEDLGSVNGTCVRGSKLLPGHSVPIAVGELVALGSISIILQQRATPSPKPAPSADKPDKAARAERATTATAERDVIVADTQMQSLHRMIEQIAGSTLGVLLLGETGVGKEVFARAVHRASRRASGPFVEINCAALTESLLESELFGHEKGAFTHASSAKAGLIESADGGTLLLDEIGDMPLATQAKLLRVIEDSQLRRVGGLKSKAIDVRFVAATNCDLETQMAAGAFRRDLFFRLNGVTLLIPPLRERIAELEPLARAFIARATRATRGSGAAPVLSSAALELMSAYSWPGNVRELKHMMERAVLLCGTGPIEPEHLPTDRMRAPRAVGTDAPATQPASTSEAAPVPLYRRGTIEEQQQIVETLERSGGNQTVTARILGMSRRTLVNRLNEYELQRPRKDAKKKPTE